MTSQCTLHASGRPTGARTRSVTMLATVGSIAIMAGARCDAGLESADDPAPAAAPQATSRHEGTRSTPVPQCGDDDSLGHASTSIPIALRMTSDAGWVPPDAAPEAGLGTAEDAAAPFGARGSRRLLISGFAGPSVGDRNEPVIAGGMGLSWFIEDGFAVTQSLDLLAFDQRTSVRAGLGYSLTFQYHFLREETWSLFAEAGAGLLLTVGDVPEEGSFFNFMPQAAMGVTLDVGRPWRLIAGVRWHHVSNARLYRTNPGRDTIAGFIGASLAF